MSDIASPPIQDSLIEVANNEKEQYIAKGWQVWLQDDLVERVAASPELFAPVQLTAQHATIGATAIAPGAGGSGRFRVSWYARITTPDGVSSSLTVSIHFTESGQALTLSGSAMTGDSVTTVQSGSVVIETDSAAAVSYGTVYASNTPDAMHYRLTVWLEAVS